MEQAGFLVSSIKELATLISDFKFQIADLI